MTDVVSYDPQELKRTLIQFLQTKPEFADFNYEGSAINTIVDLLVRNTHYIGYMSNMVATESFLDSAQQRGNVVSHAQKLSYVPKSRTAATAIADVEVIPAGTPSEFNLTCNKGSTFIKTVGNASYTFTNRHEFTLTRTSAGHFVARDVELKQGVLIRQRVSYGANTKKIELLNKNIDTSTIRVFVQDTALDVVAIEFLGLSEITEAGPEEGVFFLTEDTTGFYTIEFGKGILGIEPTVGSVVDIEYVAVEAEHANGLTSLVAATPIGGYSNIAVTVTTPAFGGSERDDIDRIKFLAPKIYEAQNRAVRDTDYKAIMLREFPYIKSANAWGGEKNVPPYYGKVFVCAVPQDGFIIAESVKSVMKNRLQKFAVAGITPEVVDAKYIGLDLKLNVIFNAAATTDTFVVARKKVVDTVMAYDSANLRTFDFWYNNSLLSTIIQKAVPSITSIEIDKRAFVEVKAIKGVSNKYNLQFLNTLEKKSLVIEKVVIDVNATSQVIVDDGNGVVELVTTKNGVTTKTSIGTINYATGDVEFMATMLDDATLKVYATPATDNFYTERDYVVYIDTVDVQRITNRV